MLTFQNNTTFYAVLMLFAGIGIPIMATLNAGLGSRLQSPALAVSILLVVALMTSIIFLLTFEGMPNSLYPASTPIYFYFGGFLFVFYILSITWVVPRFGVGNAIACVLMGQILSIAVIDHFGLMGANLMPISFQRLIGLIFMAVGVYLVVKNK